MELPRKFSSGELSSITRTIAAKQKGICPICKRTLVPISSKNTVLDHDHDTGLVRATVHRRCNGTEGKVLHVLKTWGGMASPLERIKTLENIISFWKKHQSDQHGLIYHGHKTASEKRIAIAKKRKRARAKKKEAK